MFVSKFTGENFLVKTKPKNTFDILFFLTVKHGLLVYSIAFSFFCRLFFSATHCRNLKRIDAMATLLDNSPLG